MSEGVVCLVNGGVRKRLDHDSLVPRNFRAKTVRTCAGPVTQPVNNAQELVLSLRVVEVELVFNVGADLLGPLAITAVLRSAIIHVPLIEQSSDTVVTATADNLAIRLSIREGIASINELLANQGLGFFDRLALLLTVDHGTFVEALLVGFILCFCKLGGIFGRLDLQVLNKLLGTEITIGRSEEHTSELSHMSISYA